MKNIFILVLILVITACTNNSQKASQKFIELSNYSMASYHVKNVSYHDSIANYLQNKPHITVGGDYSFNVTENLGQLLFKGNRFKYKVIGDSLFLLNNDYKYACEILKLDPNSFEIKLNNKYVDTIFFIKPKDQRKKITKTVSFSF